MKIKTSLLITATGIAFSGMAHSQTIVNGSFEDPVVAGAFGSDTYTGAAPMPGWGIASAATSDLFVLTALAPYYGQAQDKEQYVANVGYKLNGSTDDSILYQKVGGFQPKSDYALNFSLADAFGGDGVASYIDVWVEDTLGTTLASASYTLDYLKEVGYMDEAMGGSDATDWETHSLAFTATTPAVIVHFNFSPSESQQRFSAALDAVSVVPEPSAALLGCLAPGQCPLSR